MTSLIIYVFKHYTPISNQMEYAGSIILHNSGRDNNFSGDQFLVALVIPFCLQNYEQIIRRPLSKKRAE